MSNAEVIIDDSGVDQPGMRIPAPAHSKGALRVWAATACVLLATSGVVRTLQESRHKAEKSYVEACPFPLDSIPSKLGVWQKKEGEDLTLDPLTIRITGSTDRVLRTYVDELTGVSLVVLVLFGPAEPVLPHTPEVCFPSSGYSSAQDSMDREIEYTSKDSAGKDIKHGAQFRSSVYEKSGGLAVRREEAYHSFRLEGVWSPSIGAGRKFPRRNPGVFKVQVQRLVAAGERRDTKDNPIEQFLSILIPQIERNIAAGSAKQVASRS
jgi:hypothetical protein